jgi:hypothetical protein
MRKTTIVEFRATMQYVNATEEPVNMEKYQLLMSILIGELPGWSSCPIETILPPNSESAYKEFRATLPQHLDYIPTHADVTVNGVRR